jgi:hypothetical protein
MQSIRLCVYCACENPHQLDMEMHVARGNQLVAEEVAHAQVAVEDATAGLQWFQLKPEGVVGKIFIGAHVYEASALLQDKS